MKLFKVLAGAAMAAALGVTATTAAAAVTTYGDFASWSAAVPSVTSVAIPDTITGFTFIGAGNASVTYDAVTFSQSAALGNGNLFNISSTYNNCCQPDISSQVASVGVENILITLPGLTNAFSLNFGTFNGSSVHFLLSNGQAFTFGSAVSDFNQPYKLLDFFGVTDTTGFNSVLVTSSDLVLNVGNVAYGGAVPVPEPETWALMLVGFAGLGVALRTRRRLQPATA